MKLTTITTKKEVEVKVDPYNGKAVLVMKPITSETSKRKGYYFSLPNQVSKDILGNAVNVFTGFDEDAGVHIIANSFNELVVALPNKDKEDSLSVMRANGFINKIMYLSLIERCNIDPNETNIFDLSLIDGYESPICTMTLQVTPEPEEEVEKTVDDAYNI